MSAGCDREPGVVRAVVEGRWPEELAAHVRGCDDCREVVAVTSWMRDVAAAARREAAAARLPTAADIWWKAEVLRRVEGRRELTRRAVRPIQVFERAAWGAVAAVVGTLAWLNAGELEAWIAGAGAARALMDPMATLALAGISLALAAGTVWTVVSARD